MNTTPQTQMLDLPKKVLPEQIHSEKCPYNNHFNLYDKKCLWCPWGDKCRLVYQMKRLGAERPGFTMLLESFHHIYRDVYARGHDPEHCTCEECLWISQVSQNLGIRLLA